MNTFTSNPTIAITHHASIRFAQRGIAKRHVELVIRYGSFIRRQGFNFYYLDRSALVKFILPAEKVYVRHLIVVVSAGFDSVVVTAYKEEDAVRKIRKKSKHLIGSML